MFLNHLYIIKLFGTQDVVVKISCKLMPEHRLNSFFFRNTSVNSWRTFDDQLRFSHFNQNSSGAFMFSYYFSISSQQFLIIFFSSHFSSLDIKIGQSCESTESLLFILIIFLIIPFHSFAWS